MIPFSLQLQSSFSEQVLTTDRWLLIDTCVQDKLVSLTAQCDGLSLRTGVTVGGGCAGVGTRDNHRARGGCSCECPASGECRPSCKIWGSYSSVAEDSSRVRNDSWWVVPDVSVVAALFICSGRQSLGRATQCHITEDSYLQLSFCFFLGGGGGDWLRSLWSRLHSLQQRVGLVFIGMSTTDLRVSQAIA